MFHPALGVGTCHSSKVSRLSTSMVLNAKPSASKASKRGSGGPGRSGTAPVLLA
jgi:hypothetical protein